VNIFDRRKNMNCKYCGKEAKNSGTMLLAGGSSTCSASPSKKHQLAE